MSDTPKVVRSMLYWVEPPEIGQPIEELDWVWLDTYSNGKMIIRDEKPSQEEVDRIVEELKPLFDWDEE